MAAAILDKIISAKREEVDQRKQQLPFFLLKEHVARRDKPRDFARVLRRKGVNLIAEIKKASPSKGLLCPDLDPVEQAKVYAANGAAAISVLTEVDHFQGNLEYLAAIRKEVDIPLLRKDFIFDEYQIYETAAYGADALLLIAAILTQEQLKKLLSVSHKLGLKCLVEVHDEEELKKVLICNARIIGVNNRNLNTFNVDINTTIRLRPLIPRGKIVVSESGISDRNDVIKLRDCGVNAILVGEALVTTSDISSKIKELML